MKFAKVNLDAKVRFRPATSECRAIIRDMHLRPVEDGYYQMGLWDFMAVFGPCIHLSTQPLIEQWVQIEVPE